MLAKLDPNRAALLQAADILELYGHCKHKRQRSNGYCVLGAISKAATGDPWKLNSWDEPCATFTRFLGEKPAFWNNREERTAAEVIEKLRTAALTAA